jgi:F-type H+-transporting ATPase subunit alpha
VIVIWAGTNGFLDSLPVADVRRFERELLEYMDANHPEVAEHIRAKGDLPDEVVEKLRSAVEEFKRDHFTPSEEARPPREAEAHPMEEGEEEQESVKRYRRSADEIEEQAGPVGRGTPGTP